MSQSRLAMPCWDIIGLIGEQVVAKRNELTKQYHIEHYKTWCYKCLFGMGNFNTKPSSLWEREEWDIYELVSRRRVLTMDLNKLFGDRRRRWCRNPEKYGFSRPKNLPSQRAWLGNAVKLSQYE